MQLQERLMTDNNENGQARFGGNWTVVTRAETGKKIGQKQLGQVILSSLS